MFCVRVDGVLDLPKLTLPPRRHGLLQELWYVGREHAVHLRDLRLVQLRELREVVDLQQRLPEVVDVRKVAPRQTVAIRAFGKLPR